MGQPLKPAQAGELTALLASICQQLRFTRVQRDEAAYWAHQVQVQPDLDPDDAETIAWLLADVAEQPFLLQPLHQRAQSWTAHLQGRAEAGVKA
jgi:hypothetical protein